MQFDFHTNTPFCAHSHTEFLVTNYSFVICFSLQPWFFFLLPLHSITKSNFVFLSGQTNHKNPIISISLSTSIPSLWTFHRRYHFFPLSKLLFFLSRAYISRTLHATAGSCHSCTSLVSARSASYLPIGKELMDFIFMDIQKNLSNSPTTNSL